jgi:hypothetical protein
MVSADRRRNDIAGLTCGPSADGLRVKPGTGAVVQLHGGVHMARPMMGFASLNPSYGPIVLTRSKK